MEDWHVESQKSARGLKPPEGHHLSRGPEPNISHGPPCYQCPIVVTDYVGGQATGEKNTVTLYDYAFSPEFMKLVIGSNPMSVVIGSYETGEVTHLALSIETRAEATFAWQSTPNEIARVLLGEDAVSGKGAGTAEFAKKPDGSWFVDSVVFKANWGR